MQPDNIILGDSQGIDLPNVPQDEASLAEEKKMVKYSRSAEFKKIESHLRGRIEFYQKYLPDGRAIAAEQIPTPEQWIIANLVIAEFEQILNDYQRANDAIDELSSTK